MSQRSIEYDLGILRSRFARGEMDIDKLEYAVDWVLKGGHIHEHDWIDITGFASKTRQFTCSKCGDGKAG